MWSSSCSRYVGGSKLLSCGGAGFDDGIRSQAGEKFPDARVAPVWKTGPLPVNDNNEECEEHPVRLRCWQLMSNVHRTDGATRQADGDLGIIVKAGTNLQFTDLGPGASAAAVRACTQYGPRAGTQPFHSTGRLRLTTISSVRYLTSTTTSRCSGLTRSNSQRKAHSSDGRRIGDVARESRRCSRPARHHTWVEEPRAGLGTVGYCAHRRAPGCCQWCRLEGGHR